MKTTIFYIFIFLTSLLASCDGDPVFAQTDTATILIPMTHAQLQEQQKLNVEHDALKQDNADLTKEVKTQSVIIEVLRGKIASDSVRDIGRIDTYNKLHDGYVASSIEIDGLKAQLKDANGIDWKIPTAIAIVITGIVGYYVWRK